MCGGDGFIAHSQNTPKSRHSTRPLDEKSLTRRIAQISGGKLFGSAAFVSEMLGLFSEKVRSRSARARKVKGLGYASHGWMLAARLETAA